MTEPIALTPSRAFSTSHAARRVATTASVQSNKTRATIIGVCVMLLAAEGVVRARAWYRHGTRGAVAGIYQSDPLLGRRPQPGASLHGRRRSLTINSWGFRGRDFPKNKPVGVTRIAAIGDSTTFGMEASSDDAVWVARVADILNADSAERRYDVINAGVPGYTLGTCALQLSQRLLPLFKPDIVIVYALTGDLQTHTKRQFSPAETPTQANSPLTALAYKHSLLLNLIRLNTAGFRSRQMPRKRHDKLDEQGVARYVEQLERIIDVCREHDLEPILCTCPRAFGDETAPTNQYVLAQSALAHNPSLSLAGLNDAYTRYNDAVRATAFQRGATLVDLDALIPKRRTYFADAVHFNDTGHDLAAQAIARAIQDVRTRRMSRASKAQPPCGPRTVCETSPAAHYRP
ncbi:MAG: SGNH/GDSL hydrolase family protein [Phycisphaerae bacterium]